MAGDEDDGMPFFSQPPSHHPASQGSSAGGNRGRGMGFFDLNSNVDDFLDLGSYQQLLLDEPAGHGLPPIGPGCGRSVSQGGGGRTWSLNIGGGSSFHLRPFVAPGTAAVDGGIIGRGRSVSQGTGGGVRRARGASSAGNRGIAGWGFSISQVASRQRASSSAVPSEDVDDSEGMEDGDDNCAVGEKIYAKAAWTEENIIVFCNIACEEARDGHCVNGAWTTRAYHNMKTKFSHRAGLLHSTKQFKNCLTKLKSYYSAWVWLGQQTGCGRTGDGAITASNEWWGKKLRRDQMSENSRVAILSIWICL